MKSFPFSQILIDWYSTHKRLLPWRMTQDPYLIWISEIILQQTRVAQGLAYYERFIKRFPDLSALASAPEDEVLKLWQGLGYYSRARNLHAAAKSMNGGFPSSYQGVLALKGVGPYTAAAICSFAYRQPYAVVDGNVYRVLARIFGIETPIDTPAGKAAFAALAQELLDKKRPDLFNQAIMDFGAIQCTPSSPDCTACPFQKYCRAFKTAQVERLPLKSGKVVVTERFFYYICVRQGNGIWLRKRPAGDIWQGLYEPPLLEKSPNNPSAADSFSLRRAQEENWLPPSAKLILTAGPVRHILSHQVIHASLYIARVPKRWAVPDGFSWVPLEKLNKYPVSRLLLRLFEASGLVLAE